MARRDAAIKKVGAVAGPGGGGGGMKGEQPVNILKGEDRERIKPHISLLVVVSWGGAPFSWKTKGALYEDNLVG